MTAISANRPLDLGLALSHVIYIGESLSVRAFDAHDGDLQLFEVSKKAGWEFDWDHMIATLPDGLCDVTPDDGLDWDTGIQWLAVVAG